MRLYSDYIKQSRGLDTVSAAHGFVTYKITGDECYIEDVYVTEDQRKQGVGTKIMNEVVRRAKDKGCKFMTTTVGCRISNPEVSLQSCFAYGFKILTAANDIILLKMEI